MAYMVTTLSDGTVLETRDLKIGDAEFPALIIYKDFKGTFQLFMTLVAANDAFDKELKQRTANE